MSVDRCLIIKKKWLDMILSGQKTWEIRGSNTNIRGKIGLIESGSGLIVGQCNLIDSFSLEDKLIDGSKECFNRHRVENWKEVVKYKDPHAWVLELAKRYKKPCPYVHPKGAVIWVRV